MDTRKTWFIDFDGTIVYQKSYLNDEDYILPTTLDFFKQIKEEDVVIITTGRGESHKTRIENFMKINKLKCDKIICGLPTGIRIVINDKKPDGTKTAYSYNLERDQGIDLDKLKI